MFQTLVWDDSPLHGDPSNTAHWTVPLPVRLEAWLGLTECESGFGPLLFLQSSLLLSSLRARVTVADGGGRPAAVEIPLVSPAQRVTPPRQMVRASRPHPELKLLVRDDAGEALTDQAVLGACLNGWREIDAVFPADADIALQVGRRANGHSASMLVARGELTFARGCSLRLEFAFADRAPASAMDVPIAPAGRSLTLPERSARVSWTGDPSLSVSLVDDSGVPLGEERFLGRGLVS